MDVNVKLQGIFRNVVASTGELIKIKYKGGNEEALSQVVKPLKEYFVSKQFLVDNKTNPKYSQELRNVATLLIINTSFANSNALTEAKEFSHLIKAVPTLSKCVLANVVIELDLLKHCCPILSMASLHINEEFFSELINCVRQAEPRRSLESTYTSIEAIINLLIKANTEQEEVIIKLADVACEILKTVASVNAEWLQKVGEFRLSENMGYTLLSLLKLLQLCPLYTDTLSRITDDLIRAAVAVLKAVTLNIFCVWAEVKCDNDQSLQVTVGSEAYLTIEHLQKYKPAKELIQMLANIARKPKTVSEIILEADTSTMIANINKADENQKLWFSAFLNTDVFQNKDTMDCVNRWAHLCSQSDVIRLLSLSTFHKEHQVKLTILKCAKTLSIADLAMVASRYFYENNSRNLDTGNIKEELTLLLNKPQSDIQLEDDFIKEIFLLLLQNSELVLTELYETCLKKSVFSRHLEKAFKSIKVAVEIQGLSKNIFIKVFKSDPPNAENLMCYKEFLNVLLELQYFQESVLLCDVFLPYIQEIFNKNDFEMLLRTLQLLNLTTFKHVFQSNTLPLIVQLAEILEKTRCRLHTFTLITHSIVHEVTEFLLKYLSPSNILHLKPHEEFFHNLELKNPLNRFYFTSFFKDTGNQFLNYINPELNTDNDVEIVATLISILPSCVGSEWMSIVKQLELQCGYQKTLELLENTIGLLCSQAKSQLKEVNPATINTSLKFSLQQYGTIIKHIFQPKYTSLEEEVLLTKSVCNVLSDIPKDLRADEGRQLVALLSNKALKFLKEDKEFLVSIISMDDPDFCKFLAQKMM